MYASNVLAATLALITLGSAAAVPAKSSKLPIAGIRPSKRDVASLNQSCTASDMEFFFGPTQVTYTVQVGIAPDDAQTECDTISAWFSQNGVSQSGISCSINNNSDGSEYIQFTFTAPEGQGGIISNSFQSAYPYINGGFNCPDS